MFFLNIYEYNYVPDAPFREGDLKNILINCTLYSITSSIIAYITKQVIKKNFSKN
jgi:hypothetical protein